MVAQRTITPRREAIIVKLHLFYPRERGMRREVKGTSEKSTKRGKSFAQIKVKEQK
jgi:hypothetical protein